MDFSSLSPTDSSGLSIWSYTLSFNRSNPFSWGEDAVVQVLFSLYKAIAWISLFLLNLVSSFDWLRPFIELLERVSDSVTNYFGTAGVLLMAIGVALAAAGVNWMRRSNHRTLYHLGLAVVLIMLATTLVSPVRYAGTLLGVSRDSATEIGTNAVGTPHGSTLSQVLADKLVREQTQRVNFSHDLDSLGCGAAWTNYIRAGDPDKVKDAAIGCSTDTDLHAYAMNPTNAIEDTIFALASILVFAAFTGFLWGRMLGTGFATILHASSIKPLMYFLPSGAAAQTLFTRNGLAAILSATSLFCDVLIYIIGAALTAGMALITGSGAAASIITAGAMIGVMLGTRKFLGNLRSKADPLAAGITHNAPATPMLAPALTSPEFTGRLATAAGPAMRALHPSISPAAMAVPAALTSLLGRSNSRQGQLTNEPSPQTDQPSTTTEANRIADSAEPQPEPSPQHPPQRQRLHRNEHRDQQIRADYRNDRLSVDDLAAVHQLSPGRVRQIINAETPQNTSIPAATAAHTAHTRGPRHTVPETPMPAPTPIQPAPAAPLNMDMLQMPTSAESGLDATHVAGEAHRNIPEPEGPR